MGLTLHFNHRVHPDRQVTHSNRLSTGIIWVHRLLLLVQHPMDLPARVSSRISARALLSLRRLCLVKQTVSIRRVKLRPCTSSSLDNSRTPDNNQ